MCSNSSRTDAVNVLFQESVKFPERPPFPSEDTYNPVRGRGQNQTKAWLSHWTVTDNRAISRALRQNWHWR